jgi:hypothetical protein
VAQIKAKMRWLPAPAIPDGATLLLDQLPSDAAMIDPRRHRRVAWDDYVDQVRTLEREGPVVWRPHPYNPDVALLEGMLGRGTKRSENFYSLLAQDALVRVAAISSGGVVEARAFGKDGLHFMDRCAGIDVQGWTTPVPVIGHWLSPHFFSAVLSGAIDTRRDVPELPLERDFVRRANNVDWDFGWIDQIVERRSADESQRAAAAADMHQLHQHAAEIAQRVVHVEARAAQSEAHATQAEARASQAEAHATQAEARAAQAEARAAQAETRVLQVEHGTAEFSARLTDAMAQTADRAQLAAHAQMADQQLRRLQAADRPRLRALIDDVAERARANNWRVGILGAGAHTEWLLRQTRLRSLPSLVVFDGRSTVGHVEGLPVHPASRIPVMHLDAVIVSSLAFQDEMHAYLAALGVPNLRIVTCYPSENTGDAAA